MTIRIGRREVGSGCPCFVIAEAGSNHNGDLSKALQLIDVAASAGADAVKFQLFRAARMYTRNAGTSDYLNDPTPIFDIIAAMEMPYEWLSRLAEHCRACSIELLVTPFDEESADRVDPYVSAFKIASYELTHLPLVRHVAEKQKPLILSTGTATLEEVNVAVRAAREVGNASLVLLQCTAAYPAPLHTLNLRAIDALSANFGVPAGLSDHSRDPLIAPVAAVARGAAVIEKHFTLSNALAGPDHKFAVEPDELRAMVRSIRQTEEALGREGKHVDPAEYELRGFARRSLFATRRIRTGEKLTVENVAVLRCGKSSPGLEPEDLPRVLGKEAAREIAADRPIQRDDIR